MFDTIAAISTPRGEGGIGIVRISGKETLSILCEIFKPKSSRKVSELKNYTITYGHIYDGEKLVDEVLVSVMKGPRTYTREDIVEINCHGGYIITERVLELVLKKGAKLAETGEFTRRAFLNGRLDLTQAEAVMDIIHGKTEKSVSLSLNQLRGDLREQITVLKKLLLDVAAHVNVVLDYPEEGIDDPLPANLRDNLDEVIATTSKLIASYDKGKMIKEGVKTAIVGKPNVGKSSLLNSVLREERAIVTRIAGTTRDTIEEIVNIKGIPLVMIDTAGIRETEDEVENIGVQKSKSLIKNADLVLFVLDSSRELDKEASEKKYSFFFSKTQILGYKKCKVKVNNIKTKKGKKFTIKIVDTEKGTNYELIKYSSTEALKCAKEIMYNAENNIKICIYVHQKNSKILIKTLEFEEEGELLKKPKKNGKTIKYLPINEYFYSVILCDYEYEFM